MHRDSKQQQKFQLLLQQRSLLLMRIFFLVCCWKKVTKNRSLGPATVSPTNSSNVSRQGRTYGGTEHWLGQHWNPASAEQKQQQREKSLREPTRAIISRNLKTRFNKIGIPGIRCSKISIFSDMMQVTSGRVEQ